MWWWCGGALKGVVTHEGIKGEADKGWWRVWFADWIEPSWDDFSYLSINLFVWILFVSPFAETSMMRAAKLNLRMATIFSRPFIHLKKSVNRSAQTVKEWSVPLFEKFSLCVFGWVGRCWHLFYCDDFSQISPLFQIWEEKCACLPKLVWTGVWRTLSFFQNVQFSLFNQMMFSYIGETEHI